MKITLTPEIESLIRQHLAHGCSQSPESVLIKALHALGKLEGMPSQHEETTVPAQQKTTPPAEPAVQVSPLLQWMRETSGPAPSLETLRHRLARIPGSMSDDIESEREDRI